MTRVEYMGTELESIRRFKEYPLLEKKIEELTARNRALVEDKERTVRVLREEKEQTAKENAELKETAVLVGKERVTLPQLRERISRIMSEEIKEGAQGLFREYKSTWERTKKSPEVSADSARQVAAIIEELGKPKGTPRIIQEAYFKKGIYRKIKKILKNAVDADFQERVEEKSTKKAQAKLKKLMDVEWPKWYDERVTPEIADLAALFSGPNYFEAAKGEWTVYCDHCRRPFDFTVGGIEIAALHKFLRLDIQCPCCGGRSRKTLEQYMKSKVKAKLKETSASGRYSTGA